MNKISIFPHEQMEEDFKMILIGAQRQENLGNIGELDISKGITDYFELKLKPLYLSNQNFQNLVNQFIESNLESILTNLSLQGKEVSSLQERLQRTHSEMIRLIKDHNYFGKKSILINKLSDFKDIVCLVKSDTDSYREAKKLLEEGMDIQRNYLITIIRAIATIYAKALPFILRVIKNLEAIKENPTNPRKYLNESDISQDLSWIESKIASDHELFPILGIIRTYYKVIRNNNNHPGSIYLDEERDVVLVKDDSGTIETDINEFSRKYRQLTYLTDTFTRGLLYLYCKSNQNENANRLFRIYNHQFDPNPDVNHIHY